MTMMGGAEEGVPKTEGTSSYKRSDTASAGVSGRRPESILHTYAACFTPSMRSRFATTCNLYPSAVVSMLKLEMFCMGQTRIDDKSTVGGCLSVSVLGGFVGLAWEGSGNNC